MSNIDYIYQIQNGFTKKYTYPKANASNGGETHSEYNIRSSLANILSYSAAFSNTDFDPENGSIVCEYKKDLSTGDTHLNLLLGRGRGNCNAYFVDVGPFEDNGLPRQLPFKILDYMESQFGGKSYDLNSEYRFGLYLSVLYDQTIADDLGYRFICNGIKTESSGEFVKSGTHYENIYESQYKGQYFNDIGILIGTMVYIPADDYNTEGKFTAFEKNPDITKCIDIYRLGSEDGIVDTLGRLIRRLRVLNVYGGNFYVSDTLADDLSDMHSDGTIKKYGGDYRLRIHEDTSPVLDENGDKIPNTYNINGGMDLVNTNIGGYDFVIQDLFKFTTNNFNTNSVSETKQSITKDTVKLAHIPVNPYSVVLNINGTTYNDNGAGVFSKDGKIKIDYSTGTISGLTVGDNVEVSYKYNDIKISNITFNPAVIFGDISAINGRIENLISNKITADDISTPVLHIKNDSVDCVVSIENINNKNLVNFSTPIRAEKVYGAVWM